MHNYFVCPEPAGACTMNERRTSSAVWRSFKSAGSDIGVLVFVRQRIHSFIHSAQRLKVAVTASLKQFLWIDSSIARSEARSQRLEFLLPTVHQAIPILRLPDFGNNIPPLREPHVAHLAGLELGKGDRANVFPGVERIERQLRIVRTLGEPFVRRRPPGLVIDERVTASFEFVHAVDAAVQFESGNSELALLFHRDNFERRTAALDFKPFARELREA